MGTLDTGCTGPSFASLNVQPRSRAIDWNDPDISEVCILLQESAGNGQWSFLITPHHALRQTLTTSLLMGYSDYEPSLLQSAVDGETPRLWRIESTVKRRNNEACREMKTLYNLLGYLCLGTSVATVLLTTTVTQISSLDRHSHTIPVSLALLRMMFFLSSSCWVH